MTSGSRVVHRMIDLVLIVVTSVASILTTLLVVGQVWFRSLFVGALGKGVLAYAAVTGLVAIVGAAAYVLLPPPRSDR